MKWLRLGLEIVGAAALLLVAASGVWVYRSWISEAINPARPEDVRFILNWGGISTDQEFKVLGSYRSSRNITGDHLDYYCIELSRFEIADDLNGRWHDGPEQNPLLAEALERGVNTVRENGGTYFPPTEEANSKFMKIMIWSVVIRDHFATAYDIILYDSRNRRLYYVSSET